MGYFIIFIMALLGLGMLGGSRRRSESCYDDYNRPEPEYDYYDNDCGGYDD